jgi:CRP-like cAMP-binding protein
MIERLRKIAFLRALPDEVLTDWCTQLEEHRISPRETVIREGDAANEMYFFIEGQLSVHKTSKRVKSLFLVKAPPLTPILVQPPS